MKIQNPQASAPKGQNTASHQGSLPQAQPGTGPLGTGLDAWTVQRLILFNREVTAITPIQFKLKPVHPIPEDRILSPFEQLAVDNNFAERETLREFNPLGGGIYDTSKVYDNLLIADDGPFEREVLVLLRNPQYDEVIVTAFVGSSESYGDTQQKKIPAFGKVMLYFKVELGSELYFCLKPPDLEDQISFEIWIRGFYEKN